VIHRCQIDEHGSLSAGGSHVEMVSITAKLVVDVSVNMDPRSCPDQEIAERLRTDVLTATHAVEYAVRGTVGHKHRLVIDQLLQQRQIIFDLVIRPFEYTSHERQRELVADEVETSLVEALPLNREMLLIRGIELDQIIVAHDIKDRTFYFGEPLQYFKTITSLPVFDRAACVSPAKQVPRQHDRIRRVNPGPFDKPVVDLADPMNVGGSDDSHFSYEENGKRVSLKAIWFLAPALLIGIKPSNVANIRLTNSGRTK